MSTHFRRRWRVEGSWHGPVRLPHVFLVLPGRLLQMATMLSVSYTAGRAKQKNPCHILSSERRSTILVSEFLLTKSPPTHSTHHREGFCAIGYLVYRHALRDRSRAFLKRKALPLRQAGLKSSPPEKGSRAGVYETKQVPEGASPIRPPRTQPA